MQLTWLIVDGLHAYHEAPAFLMSNGAFMARWIKPETPLPQLDAIMRGLASTQGAVLVMDPDMAENLSDIGRFQASHETGAEIVFGWRTRRIGLSGPRRLLTRLFNRLVRAVLKLPLHDFNTPMISLSEKGFACLLDCPPDCPSPRLYACHRMRSCLGEVPITTHEPSKPSAYTISSRLRTGLSRLQEIRLFLLYLKRKKLSEKAGLSG